MKPCSLHSNDSGVQASEHMLACLLRAWYLTGIKTSCFAMFVPELPSMICVSVLTGLGSAAHSFPLCALAQCRGLPLPIRVPVLAGLSGGAHSELRLPRLNLERCSSPAANCLPASCLVYRFSQSWQPRKCLCACDQKTDCWQVPYPAAVLTKVYTGSTICHASAVFCLQP